MMKLSEYERWMRQAGRTLESARNDLDDRYYEWASFKAQQAAELAVKALLRGLGYAPVGHSITRLLRELREEGFGIPREILSMAMELDRNYIAPRYPDAYPEGSPFEYYSKDVAEKLISYAEGIIEFLRGLVRDFG